MFEMKIAGPGFLRLLETLHLSLVPYKEAQKPPFWSSWLKAFRGSSFRFSQLPFIREGLQGVHANLICKRACQVLDICSNLKLAALSTGDRIMYTGSLAIPYTLLDA